jgi:hypothetical protein
MTFPPERLALNPRMAPDADTPNAPCGVWRLETCAAHSAWTQWPVRPLIALMDIAAYEANGTAIPQMPLWPDLTEPTEPHLSAAR